MNVQNNKELMNLVLQIITTIDEYYDYSFKVSNDRCFIILLKLIEELERLLGVVGDVEQQIQLKDILHEVANAMANHDYVLIRDLLHYELRSKLATFK